jgi:hypothetical protein
MLSMLIKKYLLNKKAPYNFELEKRFSSEVLCIRDHDISKSVYSLHLLNEYIRFCYFEDYLFKNSHQLKKYCRLLLNFERCNHPKIIKECNFLCTNLLRDALKSRVNMKSINLSIELSNSNYLNVSEMCNELMCLALGRTVRANLTT